MQLPSILLQSVALAAAANAVAVPSKFIVREDDLDLELPPVVPEVEEISSFTISKAPIIPETTFYTAEELERVNATEAAPGEGPFSSSSGAAVEARDVHGKDDRWQEKRLEYPFTAAGRIKISYNGVGTWCSGSLVGERVVATARHCLKPDASYVFSPAYFDGDRRETAAAVQIINLPGSLTDGSCSYRDDWALLVLDKPLGKANGYFGVRAFNADAESNKPVFFNMGYPQDLQASGQHAYAHGNINVWPSKGCANGGALLHDGDTSPGQSGSPIWLAAPGDTTTRRYQYGVHVASSSVNGVIAWGPSWINAVVKAREDFP